MYRFFSRLGFVLICLFAHCAVAASFPEITKGLGWLAGLFVPLVAKTLVQVPDWAPITWMIGWSLFGYILAPYGLWKHNRAEVARLSRPERQ